MPADSFIAGELFNVTIFKALDSNPARRWANTYVIESRGAGVASDLETAILSLAEWEQLLHPSEVRFAYGRASTFVPDTSPYEGNEFVTRGLSNLAGERIVAGEILPLEVVWNVRKAVVTGRPGKIQYRGTLSETEVSAPAGEIRFSSPGSIFTFFTSTLAAFAAQTSYNVSLGTSTASDATKLFGLVIPFSGGARDVVTVSSGNPSVVQFGRRWFNRGSDGP